MLHIYLQEDSPFLGGPRGVMGSVLLIMAEMQDYSK